MWHTPGEHRGYVIVWVGLACFGALGVLTAARCASAPSRARDHVPDLSL
jgi:cytochrome oxidase assembly protein ShyY1